MKTKPVRAWELERYLLGELPSARMDEIKRMLENDPELSEEMAVLKRSSEDILKRYPPGEMGPRIKLQFEREHKDRAARPVFIKRLLYAAPVLAAALVVLIIVFHNPGGRTVSDIEGLQGTRIKGSEKIDVSRPYILVHRKTENTVELLEEGDSASAGDLLQIAYAPVGAMHGVILSIDGRGMVTLHYPESADKDPILDQDKRVPLSTSYELDDAPDFERFFFVTSKSAFDVQAILNTAKVLAQNPEASETAELDLPDSFDQYSLLIKKGESQ